MDWVYDDGGRASAGYKGEAGDCVSRAIAIATGLPYQRVYSDLSEQIKTARLRSRRVRRNTKGSSPRDGVPREAYEPYLVALGWQWTPTMKIGSGCTTHLQANELPGGHLIVRLSGHMAAVIDGVVHDTHDPRRDGTRCVYGYWSKQP